MADDTVISQRHRKRRQQSQGKREEREGEKTNYGPKGPIYKDDMEFETSHRGNTNFPRPRHLLL